jgi:hypothetical protein
VKSRLNLLVLLSITLLAVLGILSGCGNKANSGQSSPVSSPASPDKASDEALRRDAEIIAQKSGLTADEALHQLELQQAFSDLNLGPQLENNEAGTFGGLWIQHQPQYKLVVAFTRDGEAAMQKYMPSIPAEIAPYIEIRTVKYSQANLLKDQQKITAALGNLGIPCDSATYIMDNNVRISIAKAKQSDFEKAVQSGQLEVPETVKVDFVDSLAKMD